MGPHATYELDARERRFFVVALRRGVAQSSWVRTFALGTCASSSIGLIALMDSTSSLGTRVMLCLGVAFLLATVIAARYARQRGVRDALLAIDRCGECGHKLRGTNRPLSRGISTKTCTECGTTWTDLHRRDSISTVYGCA